MPFTILSKPAFSLGTPNIHPKDCCIKSQSRSPILFSLQYGLEWRGCPLIYGTVFCVSRPVMDCKHVCRISNFWFVILAVCKCNKCPDLKDEHEFPIWPACYSVLEPQLEALDNITLDKVLHSGGGKVQAMLVTIHANVMTNQNFCFIITIPIYPFKYWLDCIAFTCWQDDEAKLCFVNKVTIQKDFYPKI